MADLRTMLAQTHDFFGDNGASMNGYVLEHGAEHKPMPKPAGIEWGKVRECFKNASHLAISRDLTYCEGYAIHNFPLPIHHAWCIDEFGNVLDNTWRTPGASYIGIELTPRELLSALRNEATYGVLETLTRNELKAKRKAA